MERGQDACSEDQLLGNVNCDQTADVAIGGSLGNPAT